MSKTRWHLTVTSDWHCGSVHGLSTEDDFHAPNDTIVRANQHQLQLMDWLEADILEAKRHAKEARAHKRGLLLVGDLTDGGMHHGTHELMHPSPDVEKQVIGATLRRVADIGKFDVIIGVRGTPSHVGQQGAREESALKALKADGYPVHEFKNGRTTTLLFRHTFGGFKVDARHHGKMGRTPRTRQSYTNMYAMDILIEDVLSRRDPPDIAFRAHNHRQALSAKPLSNSELRTQVVALPCYQYGTEWVRRVAIEGQPDIGLVSAVFDPDRRWPEIEFFSRNPMPPGHDSWTEFKPTTSFSF